MTSGRLEVITGPMFSGKSEELIRRVNRFKYSKPLRDILFFKHKIHSLPGNNRLSTHSGVNVFCRDIEEVKEILTTELMFNEPPVIGLDEAQFFDEYEDVKYIQTMVELGNQVFISGLSRDSRGEPFGYMPEILCMADHITTLTALCTVCGGEATMTYRKTPGGSQINTDDGNNYESRCRLHWEAR